LELSIRTHEIIHTQMTTATQNMAKINDRSEPESPAVKKPKKFKIFLIILIVMLSIGGLAWFYMIRQAGDKEHDKEKVEVKASSPPVYLVMEPFTVNLKPEGQFLQATFTLQMENSEELTKVKTYMPQIRSRLLLMLSNKTVEELSTLDGKEKLGEEITKLVEEPYIEGSVHTKVTNVFFTSFVIQ
jgi:flagellar FliL protein